MTHPAATIPLTYGGEDLQAADLSLFLEITQGLNELPEVRGRDVLIPYLDGQRPRPRRPDTLRLVLAGHVMGNGAAAAARQADYRTTMRALGVLFDTARDPADLVATLEDGATATISARPLSIMANEQVPSEFAKVSIELLSIDPEWTYSVAGSGS